MDRQIGYIFSLEKVLTINSCDQKYKNKLIISVENIKLNVGLMSQNNYISGKDQTEAKPLQKEGYHFIRVGLEQGLCWGMT